MMDINDEIEVRIHWLVYDYTMRTNPQAAQTFVEESKLLELTQRPENLGTLEQWWADFEQSPYFNQESEGEEISLAERLWEMAVNNEKSA